jgi:predicted small metal-binding protein
VLVTMRSVRVIRCDCGFEATGDGDDELVGRAQSHAREVHGIEMAAEFVLGLAKARVQPPEK